MKKLFCLFLVFCASAQAQKVTNLTSHQAICTIDWLGQPAWVIVAWGPTYGAPQINIATFQPPSAYFSNSRLIPIAIGAIEGRISCPYTSLVSYTSNGYYFDHGPLINGLLIKDFNGFPVATTMKWQPSDQGPNAPTVYQLRYIPTQYGQPCGQYMAPELMIIIARFELG